tara:strand:- start:1793 stop:2962 length:1170 start_codon:yes stop_codon:yes gene_type:complete
MHFLVGCVVAAILAISTNSVVQAVSAAALLCMACAHLVRFRSNCFRIQLVTTDDINEAIVVEARLAGRTTLFIIDTGYAGPPVLSASYLALDGTSGDVASQYTAAMIGLNGRVTSDEQHRAIDAFISDGGCLPYTSGCTMRLMGIGSTKEQQADMLLCPMLEMRATSGWWSLPKRHTSAAHADVFVTNPLPTSVHILTSDFLLHSSPAYISFSAETLYLNMSAHDELLQRARAVMHPMVLSGGAFVAPVLVGSETFMCTVDTGATGPLCLDSEAAERLHQCTRPEHPLSLHQSGVNGEHVCSDIVVADVQFCGSVFDAMPVFVNSARMDHVDGYIGMGLLRAFNILVTSNGVGFIRNELSVHPVASYSSVATRAVCGTKHRCGSATPAT